MRVCSREPRRRAGAGTACGSAGADGLPAAAGSARAPGGTLAAGGFVTMTGTAVEPEGGRPGNQ